MDLNDFTLGILEAILKYWSASGARKAHFGDLEACSLAVNTFIRASGSRGAHGGYLEN
jgi:hypothetical protein